MTVIRYGEITILRGGDGKPYIDGEIPNRIGVTRDLMTNPPADGVASGAWKILDGELTILHTRWRQIGMDGPDMYLFERCPA